MRCYIERSDRFIARSVCGYKPDDNTGFIQQKSGAVCTYGESPCAVFAVDLDNLLLRPLKRLHVQIRINHRIVEWISCEFVHCESLLSDIMIQKKKPSRKDAGRLFSGYFEAVRQPLHERANVPR